MLKLGGKFVEPHWSATGCAPKQTLLIYILKSGLFHFSQTKTMLIAQFIWKVLLPLAIRCRAVDSTQVINLWLVTG